MEILIVNTNNTIFYLIFLLFTSARLGKVPNRKFFHKAIECFTCIGRLQYIIHIYDVLGCPICSDKMLVFARSAIYLVIFLDACGRHAVND